jgi:hypothetical protein
MAPGIERLGSWICCAYLGRGLGSMNRKYSVQEVLRTASTASGPAYRDGDLRLLAGYGGAALRTPTTSWAGNMK